MHGRVNDGHDRARHLRERELGEVKLGCLGEIGDRIVAGDALTNRANLG